MLSWLLMVHAYVCMPSAMQGRELREKRAQYLQQQQLLKEEAAAKR
jgi:hypothetical protein